ncbi:MAG: MraY family glycosyltransferase [Bacteroidota bacterium]
MPQILEVAYAKKLFDAPDDRKVHTQAIPSLGGVGVGFGAIIALLFWAPAGITGDMKFVFVALLFLFVMAIKDDLVPMEALPKLIIQIGAASLVVGSGLWLNRGFGILGIQAIPAWIGMPLSVLLLVGITNAFNLIDGIDGLAGGLGGINCLTLGSILWVLGETEYAVLSFGISGALLAFLRFNFNSYPKKMFMGDTGSLLLGFAVAVFSLKIVVANPLSYGSFRLVSPPLFVLGVILIPVLDLVRVAILRISKGKSPFSPDKTHVHHELLKFGLSHGKASAIIYLANLLLVSLMFGLREYEAPFLGISLVLFGSLATQLFIVVRYYGQQKRIHTLDQRLTEFNQDNQFISR